MLQLKWIVSEKTDWEIGFKSTTAAAVKTLIRRVGDWWLKIVGVSTDILWGRGLCAVRIILVGLGWLPGPVLGGSAPVSLYCSPRWKR